MSDGKIYFLRCGDRIKIGYSADVENRQKELATGAPNKLELIGHIPGRRRDESTIHRYLEAYRTNGEWFTDSEPVRACIGMLLTNQKALKTLEGPRRRFPELGAALQRIAAPITREEKIGEAIQRAAHRAGLGYWRTFDVWYGKARRVSVGEAMMIRDALCASLAERIAPDV